MFLHRSSGTVLDTAFFFSSLCKSCFRMSCSLVTEPVKSLISLLYLNLLCRDVTCYVADTHRRTKLRLYNNEN